MNRLPRTLSATALVAIMLLGMTGGVMAQGSATGEVTVTIADDGALTPSIAVGTFTNDPQTPTDFSGFISFSVSDTRLDPGNWTAKVTAGPFQDADPGDGTDLPAFESIIDLQFQDMSSNNVNIGADGTVVQEGLIGSAGSPPSSVQVIRADPSATVDQITAEYLAVVDTSHVTVGGTYEATVTISVTSN